LLIVFTLTFNSGVTLRQSRCHTPHAWRQTIQYNFFGFSWLKIILIGELP